MPGTMQAASQTATVVMSQRLKNDSRPSGIILLCTDCPELEGQVITWRIRRAKTRLLPVVGCFERKFLPDPIGMVYWRRALFGLIST